MARRKAPFGLSDRWDASRRLDSSEDPPPVETAEEESLRMQPTAAVATDAATSLRQNIGIQSSPRARNTRVLDRGRGQIVSKYPLPRWVCTLLLHPLGKGVEEEEEERRKEEEEEDQREPRIHQRRCYTPSRPMSPPHKSIQASFSHLDARPWKTGALRRMCAAPLREPNFENDPPSIRVTVAKF